MLQHLALVFLQTQRVQHEQVALDDFGSGEADGDACARGVILNEVDDGVDAAVHRAAVVVLAAEVLPQRALLVFGDVDRVAYQLVHALVFCRRDGHDRHAKHRLHGVDVDRALIAQQLVHHIEREHHRHVHLQKLHGEVEIALDVRGVHDVDDRRRLAVQDEIARNDLLAAVRRHGVDARQVRDERARVAVDRAVLAVNGHAGEIADVLARAGELVKKRRFAAVLIADKRIRQRRALRQRVLLRLAVKAPLFAETGVVGVLRAL